jgi:8-oxo-dGTP diphosphatase
MAGDALTQHFAAPAAVMLLLFREHEGRRQVMLQHRHNVKVLNDLWDTAVTGHVERGESLREALAREAGEELGITIRPEDLVFSSFGHILVRPGFTYYNIYFEASAYLGEPVIAEPDKCDAIGWFDVEDLPPDIIPERTQAIRDHFAGVHYHEAGFETRP